MSYLSVSELTSHVHFWYKLLHKTHLYGMANSVPSRVFPFTYIPYWTIAKLCLHIYTPSTFIRCIKYKLKNSAMASRSYGQKSKSCSRLWKYAILPSLLHISNGYAQNYKLMFSEVFREEPPESLYALTYLHITFMTFILRPSW